MSFSQREEQEEVAPEQAAPDVSKGATGPAPKDTAALQQALEEQRARAEQLLANWQRAEADMANLRKRVEQERQEVVRYANATLASNLLPVLDDLERALASVEKRLEGLTWIDGIRLIYYRTRSILEAHGVTAIEALGKQFDPREHEAVLYGEGEEGKVIDELQKGYKFHDRVLRPTMVKVGQKKESDQTEAAPGTPQEEHTPPEAEEREET